MPKQMKKRHLLDYSILIPYLILCSVGIIMVYSATSVSLANLNLNPMSTAINQGVFWVLSLVAITLIYKMKTKVFQNKRFILSILSIIFVLLLLVRFTPLGQVRGGAKGWIIIGSFSMQPAEYLKIMIVWYLAYILARRQTTIKKDFWGVVLHPLTITGFMIGLVLIQPDVGNAAILTLITLVMVLASGTNWFYSVLVGGIGVVGSVGLIQLFASVGQKIFPANFQYIARRFEVVHNPFIDEKDAGHQMVNSYYAIFNGGLFGRGLGNSIQKKGYLPEAHTDFMFSIVVEELGLIVSLILLGLLVFLIARIFLVGVRAKDPFNALMCIGLGAMFLIQLFINLGGILGIIPLTGITFPFLSQGGNSLLILSVGVGFALNISADEKRRRFEQQ
ncbi:FtsW/RodA/SpoVE family cell cycle protein [Enterococcus canis]|nr:FtsW/RodA/SpoVE family cell cycle protein [Enterococcus canis]